MTKNTEHCYVPTPVVIGVYVLVCDYFYKDGIVGNFSKYALMAIRGKFRQESVTLKNMTEVEQSLEENEYLCVSYRGEYYISDNPECEGYVCDGVDKHRIDKNEEEAKRQCSELLTKCSIPEGGCVVDYVGNYPESLKPLTDSYRTNLRIFDMDKDTCKLYSGTMLDQVNSSVQDKHQCLSQVYGCLSYNRPVFVCGEKSIYYNMFEYNERVLKPAVAFRFKSSDELEDDTVLKYNYIDGNTIDAQTFALAKQFVDKMKELVMPFFKNFNDRVHRYMYDCFMTQVDGYVDNPIGKFTIGLSNELLDTNEMYRITKLTSSNSNEEVKFYEFQRCYYCGSPVIVGLNGGSMDLNNIYQVSIDTFYDETKYTVKENLGYEFPIFYNDEKHGIDKNNTIAYIVGDGFNFNQSKIEENTKVYLGIGVHKNVDFQHSDKYTFSDFALYTDNKGDVSESITDYTIEVLNLKCLKSDTDDNKLAFNFDNSYIICEIPNDIFNSIKSNQFLVPVYRLPKSEIHGKDDSSSSDDKIAAIAGGVSGGIIFILIIAIIITSIILFLRYRKEQGRRQLKMYNEHDLNALGGLLNVYD